MTAAVDALIAHVQNSCHSYAFSFDRAAVKDDAEWKFGRYDFNGWPMVNGVCPRSTQAIKCVYNKCCV